MALSSKKNAPRTVTIGCANWEHTPTLVEFQRSPAFFRGIMGPRGSAKSTVCSNELFARGVGQKPDGEKVRKTRFAVIRNTYKELEDTTLKTWLTWFPEEAVGAVNRTKMIHHLKLPLPDGTRMDMEVLFRALDRPDDIKKVLSLELTGAWVNEAREVPKGLIDGLSDAVGRFPAIKDGGPTWRGIICDTNPPDDSSWWYRLAEHPPWPDNWEFFKQPGGLVELPEGGFVGNPRAENIPNLEENYYLTRAAGKDADHVRVYYCNQYGFVKEGKPVIPEYIDAKHCIEEDYVPRPGSLVYVGLDFGLTPAAVFGQRLGMGRWVWFDELVTEDMGAVRFAEILGGKLRGEYKDCNLEIYGDPAGDYRAGTDERTPFLILREQGIMAYPAPSNDPVLRREAIAAPLTRLIDGEPGLVITRRCAMTRKGLAGGYFYRRLKVSGDERFQEKPSKNRYSHPVEAGGYMMLGAGEGRRLVGQDRSTTYKENAERFRSDYGSEAPGAWMVM